MVKGFLGRFKKHTLNYRTACLSEVRLTLKLKSSFAQLLVFALIALTLRLAFAQGSVITMPFVMNPVVVVDGSVGGNEYKGSYHETTTGMTVYFEQDGTNMYIALESNSTGWLGIGFGPTNTGMDEANMLIGYVEDSSGTLVLNDEFGQGWAHPSDISLGGTDNIVSKAGTQNAGKTIIEFTFPLATSDAYDYNLAQGSTYGFFLAYNQNKDDLTSFHTAFSPTIDLLIESPKPLPTADFTYAVNGFTVQFTENATANVGSITGWSWDFGDGTNAAEQNPTHTYPNMNDYSIKLTVTDSEGGQATKIEKISVPTHAERLLIWTTQVVSVSVMIALISFFAFGITTHLWKRGGGK